MPPDLIERSTRYVSSLHWYIRGMDIEDLVGIFMLGGLETCHGKPFDWGHFARAGVCDLMDAVKSEVRRTRRANGNLLSIDEQVAVTDPSSGISFDTEKSGWIIDPCDQYADANARITVRVLMQAATSLSVLEREAILAFLRGERDELWGGREGSERDRRHNATFKAIKKLRKAANRGPEEVRL